jgi:hypothetical protein
MVDFMEHPWKIHDLVSTKNGLETTNKYSYGEMFGDKPKILGFKARKYPTGG